GGKGYANELACPGPLLRKNVLLYCVGRRAAGAPVPPSNAFFCIRSRPQDWIRCERFLCLAVPFQRNAEKFGFRWVPGRIFAGSLRQPLWVSRGGGKIP